MSLTVTDEHLALAEDGKVDDEIFAGIIRTSLPFAYKSVAHLAGQLRAGMETAFVMPPHMEDAERNQLLRLFASTSMRHFMERYFGIAELAFQNCHYVGAATTDGIDSPEWRRFTS